MWFKEKKKVIALAVLVLGLVSYWANTYFKAGTSGKAVVQAPVKNTAAEPVALTAIKVDVDLLKRAVEPYRTAKNIFTPVYTKPELEKPSKPNKSVGVPVTVTPLPPLPPPPPPKPPDVIAAENAREEMQKIKVVGFLKRKQRTDVFLSLGNSNYIVGKGDVITKEYYLGDIAKDSVVVSDRVTGVQVKIPADFSGKNAKSVVLPGVGRTSAPSPAYQQSNTGIMPGTGRSPGQRTPEVSGGGIYGGGGALPPQNTGTNPGGNQGIGIMPAPLGRHS